MLIGGASFTTKVDNLPVYTLHPNQSNENENCSFNLKPYLHIANKATHFGFISKKLDFEIQGSPTNTIVCPSQWTLGTPSPLPVRWKASHYNAATQEKTYSI